MVIAQLTVLDDFARRAIDVGTGGTEPAAVIWLTTYFVQEGRAESLRDAVAGVEPTLLPDFDRVRAIETLMTAFASSGPVEGAGDEVGRFCPVK